LSRTYLGLAISKRFCQMMGGDISVESEPDRGSTFTIRLPRIVGVRKPRPRPAANSENSKANSRNSVDKVRLNLEKFVWSSRRKIAKENSENSDAMRTLKGWQKMAIFARGGQDALYPALSGEWEVPVTRNAKITPVNERGWGWGRGRGASPPGSPLVGVPRYP
jgi:Histidine kinase-, DNA gyrase B-, and HSP90-like ATPase